MAGKLGDDADAYDEVVKVLRSTTNVISKVQKWIDKWIPELGRQRVMEILQDAKDAILPKAESK